MKENASFASLSKGVSLAEDWAGCPVLSDGQQSVPALLVEQPGGDVITHSDGIG